MNSTQLEQNPTHIWFDIPEKLNNTLLKASQSVGTPAMCNRTYLNRLCESVVLPYLQDYEPQARVLEQVAELWKLGINGVSVTLDQQRLLLVPSTAWDLDSMEVPQEWVDIPELAVDYLIAVQIDLDDAQMRLWGYSTHEQIKALGEYRQRQRAYLLDCDHMTESVNTLWSHRVYFPKDLVGESLEAIAKPSGESLQSALTAFRNDAVIFPNRMVPFDTWSSLITDDHWRQQVLAALTPSKPAPNVSATRLLEWFENRFDENWSAVTDLISPALLGQARSQASQEVKQATLIDLHDTSAQCQVALMMMIESNHPEFVVKASLYPTGDNVLLPANLTMKILTEDGEVFHEVTSVANDPWIRYEFDVSQEDSFSIQILLEEACITKSFTL